MQCNFKQYFRNETRANGMERNIGKRKMMLKKIRNFFPFFFTEFKSICNFVNSTQRTADCVSSCSFARVSFKEKNSFFARKFPLMISRNAGLL